MPLFTEEQITELERIFGIKAQEGAITIRTGIAYPGDKVWWRGAEGPEEVVLDASHLRNAKDYPQVYQHHRPAIKVQYID
jgi:hypothetical protein